MRKLMIPLTRNPISLAGTALMFICAILFATLLLIEVLGAAGNPYTGSQSPTLERHLRRVSLAGEALRCQAQADRSLPGG